MQAALGKTSGEILLNLVEPDFATNPGLAQNDQCHA
jgi:hypothetical protein